MNFFQLECFVMAVEKSSFAEVASAMHVTQPTITYQINNLEEELEEKMFLRTKRGVAVTRAGRLFYDDARKILEQYHLALKHFRTAVSLTDSVIRVGFTRPPDNYDIFSAIHLYREQHPDLVIDVVRDKMVTDASLRFPEKDRLSSQAAHFDVILHYRYNETDFADLEEYTYIPLGHCPYYVLLSQFSPLAKEEALSLEDLKGLKLLTHEDYKYSKFQVPSLDELKRRGIDVGFYDNMDQLMYAIADRAGFGIYPAKYREVKAGFRRVPLTSLAPLEYGLLFRREHSAAVEDFLQFLIEKLRDE